MRVSKIEREYNIGDTYYDFFCSDIHMDSINFDKDLFISEMNYAKKLNANIYVGGDLFDCLMPSDRKRYTKGSDTSLGDDVLNETLDRGIELLTPYAKNIKVILCGNHETSIAKYHHFDIISLLIYELNKMDGVHIDYLGYSGFIRFVFSYSKGTSKIKRDMYADHGKGGGAVVTKGTIGMNRAFNKAEADFYWSGHTHTKVVLPSENQIYLNQYGDIKIKERKAFISGAYVKPAVQDSLTAHGRPKGYRLDYGEEKMTSLQSSGGILVQHDMVSNSEIKSRIIC